MFFEDSDRKFKMVGPDVDELLRYFDRGLMNPTSSTSALLAAFDPLWNLLTPLVPLKKNEEAKAIWLRIPRGEITDYATFEEMKEYGEVETYEEYEKLWKQEYPEEYCWYELVAVKSFNLEGSLRYYGISFGNKSVISALTEERVLNDHEYYAEGAAIKLCELITPAVEESVSLLLAGTYNEMVAAELPYQFRVGVIKRSDLWSYLPEAKEAAYDGLCEETVEKFRDLISSGINDEHRIGRIKDFTANDFFKACKIGYEAIGKDCEGFTLPDLYMHYADGLDEGLTGKGHGLNAGPGIDFDSPEQWDEWYFSHRGGGHPWEVVPGGNSTHVELYVRNDRRELEWELRSGKITEDEYEERMKSAGYYFSIVGIQRQFEAVSFYVALSEAGLPVVIEGAEELLGRFEAADYIGIVPHHLPTRYCESLFPDKYGDIIDFSHVYKSEDAWFEKIEWLPEEESHLVSESQN